MSWTNSPIAVKFINDWRMILNDKSSGAIYVLGYGLINPPITSDDNFIFSKPFINFVLGYEIIFAIVHALP